MYCFFRYFSFSHTVLELERESSERKSINLLQMKSWICYSHRGPFIVLILQESNIGFNVGRKQESLDDKLVQNFFVLHIAHAHENEHVDNKLLPKIF
jgi:hypothetical protein